ncbi:MAG TPA: type II secretion system protein GspL [Steroidobacteraceae bacterium]|jgi:general secretion pathway protein L|nr:type II secretion system protein GspL [Steroidobacteraceae bacterium]
MLLRLPPPGQEETEWLVIDESLDSATTRQRGSLTLAAAVSRTGKVVALAPATQILLAEPELPPGSGLKLARAVPFALEEQLTEDIDQMTFAIGRRRQGGGTPVAAVSRAVLEGWLSDLKAAGLEPLLMYPDISLMPENPGQTVLWLEKARLAVRRPGALPFAVELSPVSEALVVAGVIPDPLDTTADLKVPESAILYVTREDWAHSQTEFERLAEKFDSLKVQLLPDGALPWLARGLQGTEAVNLLQGDFARATDFGARWSRWRTAALLAAAFFVLHLAAQALQIHQAKRETAALDGQIAGVFSTAMPAETMRDPRRQMQTRLERIHKSGASPEYFLRALKVLSGALAVTPKTEIDALSYRDDSVDLKARAPSLAALSQLSQYMSKQGMTAEIQSSTPVAGGVEAHIQLRGQAPRAHQ